jgi:hypothetical protein
MILCAKRGLAIVTGCLVLGSSALLLGEDEVMPIKGLRLPLERGEDGKIKSQLLAAFARVPPEGPIEAKEVRVEFFKDDKVDTLMLADECQYDRAEGTAKSEKKVRIEREGAVITGTGFECSVKDQSVKILHEVKVVLDRSAKKKLVEEGKSHGQ